jgi:hypothetical protein
MLSQPLIFPLNIADELFYLVKSEQGFSPIKVDLTFGSQKGRKKIDRLYRCGDVNRGFSLFFVTIGTAKIAVFGPNIRKDRKLHALFWEIANKEKQALKNELSRN